MAARIRKLKQELPANQPNPEGSKSDQPLVTKYKFEPEQKRELQQPKDKSNYSYVYSDLKHVGLIVVITLFFQIGLNLTLRMDFAKLLLRSLGIEI